MTFRKISLTFLMITLGVRPARTQRRNRSTSRRTSSPRTGCAGERAIAQEKVLIKNIQQRTPLVETYIQDTRPDVKLYEVPVDDQYMLSRVDFGKGFFDKTYEPKQRSRQARLLQGLICRHHRADQGAGPGEVHLFPPASCR
jgi:hypothetical protein